MTERTEDAKKIIAAIEGLVGGPWKLSAQQRADATKPLRRGTADEVIAALPEQIENLRAQAAYAIPGWEPDEVDPISIARSLMLSAPSTTGKGSSNKKHIFLEMDREDIWQEGYQDGYEDGYDRCQEQMVADLYKDALMREPEKRGLQHHLRELDDGRSFFQKAIDFYYSPERQRLIAEGAE